jgi:hypothetical protein
MEPTPKLGLEVREHTALARDPMKLTGTYRPMEPTPKLGLEVREHTART